MSIINYFILSISKMDKIKIIQSQTDYTEESAIALLEKHNNDHIKVIREYLGLKDPEKPEIKSVNQEIYKLLRKQIDISKYNSKINEQNAKQLE